MLILALKIAFLMVGLALLFNFYRLIKGPSLPDRILALDTIYINSIAILILFGLYQQSALYFEAALLIAVMGFVGTVALSKYLLRGDIME
ncbi:MAG: K+/H+ antiporter subunit F [Piscirickettsiaceae bacterium CG_4_9_14_3_um_filter_43_564]|nr:K+/H+ antiporter subunit F [Thiomicrospira sp.]OIP94858.1 MAG: K+/H+ antiporter subunit F [Thiomicrospira sp. CG2_30_44_34]PIQ05940.1 MAG: K+/H+ antiporter subunit F [Piscirickettsiaceae bacterium CG18_big_fil_WC_8_21_14_2_50_44_103]PIU37709.1 MAG: K+/H+ antiporter subunit F [Piscirickettsiaceae bacterium CG07_land_8_20_14_0_80_44_28]PIW56927.1 MAG: K+/H+ antiporter subunit F [Piscirickettsiaceae bacterium CG12_big_fil_rev_8_21_14_0_65_44_934]PIW77414.1 MAG: K+/H+ antiporter subunit F [Pisc